MYLFLILLTDLSSQVLRELFPEYGGEILPPVETFKYEPNAQLINLRRIVDEKLNKFDEISTLVARDQIIIGWLSKDIIKPVADLFGETDHVFNTRTNKFVKLFPEELERLGVDRRISFVCGIDDAAAAARRAKHEKNKQANHPVLYQAKGQGHYQEHFPASQKAHDQAHYQAKHDANLQAIYQSHLEARRQTKDGVTPEASIQSIHKAYHEAYDEAYHNYLREDKED